MRPHTIVESPDSVGLSAKEPMNLVDKRLDKATAPRLLWVRLGHSAIPAHVRFSSDCVAKLSLRRPMNRDSVE